MDRTLWYFAYGSNMLRSRLEARVGPIRSAKAGVLEGYRHSFTKLGDDGTGKGNIVSAPGHRVYGVLYELEPSQLEQLVVFENGYRGVTVAVTARIIALDEPIDVIVSTGEEAGAAIDAHTFEALAPVPDMRPGAGYLDYYVRGMHENGLPELYRAFIHAQARLHDEGDDPT